MLPLLLKAAWNPIHEAFTEYHLRRQEDIPAVVAIDALAEIGLEVVPHLLESLKYRTPLDATYLDNVYAALVTIGSKGGNEQVVELLTDLTNNVTASQRNIIFEALGGSVSNNFGKRPDRGYKPGKVIPTLAAALRKKDSHTRAAALASIPTLVHLNLINRTDSNSIAALIPYFQSALRDQDWRVRCTAVKSMEKYRTILKVRFRKKLRLHQLLLCRMRIGGSV